MTDSESITVDWTEPDDQPDPGGEFRIIGTFAFTVPADHGLTAPERWAVLDHLTAQAEGGEGDGPLALQEQHTLDSAFRDFSEPVTYTYNIITNEPEAINPHAVETRIATAIERYLNGLKKHEYHD